MINGAFHRKVALVTREITPSLWEARGAIEDDFHHFRVLLRAQDGIITGADTTALRNPNNYCAAAGDRLGELLGKPLSNRAASVMGYTDARQQCTHQFDLAAQLVAAISRKRPWRHYEVTVPDRVEGRTSASAKRDGIEVLCWEMEGATIIGPASYAGRSIGSGFTGFVQTLDEDEAEAALVLRRSVHISMGRMTPIGTHYRGVPLGGCWAWQPERLDTIVRDLTSRQDFSHRADMLLAEDRQWLAFRE